MAPTNHKKKKKTMNYHPYQPQAAATSSNGGGGAAASQDQPITAPTCRDVLNGRGQGVQRHPGNVKYRTLVFVNKGLYAKCPRSDKIKISKGIVASVRELGGRFLELDERTGIYRDIGDKKATEKTSQALREGQTKIRKQMYKDEEMAGNNNPTTHDTSLLGSNVANSMPPAREISAEGYFGYSVQVLESLYNEEDGDSGTAAASSGGGASKARPAMATALPPAPAAAAAPAAFGSTNAAAMAMALDQFPGAAPMPMQTDQKTMPPPPPLPPVGQGSIGRFTNSSVRITEQGGRQTSMTNMSLGSLFSITSIRQLLESSRNSDDRASIQSVLSSEIRDLIRLSEPQLMQVDNFMDDGNIRNNGAAAAAGGGHVDKEIALFDEDTMKDRVSELRFTDITQNAGFGGPPAAAAAGGEEQPRMTESTSYSQTSLMDASMMTISPEDMSVHSGSDGGKKRKSSEPQEEEKKGKGGKGDRASAELLLGLSGEKEEKTQSV